MALGLTFAMVCCPAAVFAASPATQPDAAIESRVRELVKAQADSEIECGMEHACHQLFLRATDEEINTLVVHPNSGVALGAAWERVRRTVPIKTPKEKDHDVPDKEMVGRFLGVVEGRTQVNLPPLWERVVRCAVSRNREFGFSTPEMQAYFTGEQDESPLPKRPTYECSSDSCLVAVGSKRWSRPLDDNGPFGIASVLASEGATFLALSNLPYDGYPLYAVNKGGQVLWKSQVWGAVLFKCGSGGGYTGAHPYDIELRRHNDAVIVFGMTGPSIYIEAFDTKTGKNLYRFCTGYFEHEEE